MKDHKNRTLGVIQLINKKKNGNIIAFDLKDELMVYSLAGQAAVTIENSILYRNMDYLLQEYSLITHQEIIKRKRTDDEVSKLLGAVEHNPAAVVITDIKGNIQYVNHKFTELTGYTYQEAIAKNTRILKSGEHSKQFYEDFWEIILSGQEWYGEFHNKKKDGSLYWESSSISPLKDENDNIKNFIAVKEDITDKKVMNKRLEDKNNELKQTIIGLNNFQFQLMQREKITGIDQLSVSFNSKIKNPLGLLINNYETLKTYAKKLKEYLLIYKDFVDNFSILTIEEKNEQIQYIKNCDKDSNINLLLDDLFVLLNNPDENS
jgi:two-component system, NtrC family, sensor kinase